jgi:hypothetical protein
MAATSGIRSLFSSQSFGTIIAKEIVMTLAPARLLTVGPTNPKFRVSRGKWLDDFPVVQL